MHKIMAVSALACTIGLSGCATNAGTGTGVGCAIGSVIGVLLTKDAKGAALGCVAGGTIGFVWGKSLDEKERRELAEASIRAAEEEPTGERVAWGGQEAASAAITQAPSRHARPRNKRHHYKPKPAPVQAAANSSNGDAKTASATPTTNSATGWVVPVSDKYVASDGQTCRKLQQVVTKDGDTHQREFTTCKSATGWVLPDSA